MQTAKAASRPLTGEQSGYADYVTGKGASARKDANDAIGVGEKFGAMSDANQIDEMRKVKENSARGFFSGIDSSNAELHTGVDKDGNRYNRSVDQAIFDDVTGATEKGASASAHASNLREKFGHNLDKASEKGLTLAQTVSTIDDKKIDAQVGDALGTMANKAVGVDYVDNAMYGEISKQQSTKAKLDAQGGVGGAVGIDITEAGQKASQQKGAVEGLQSEAEKIGQKIGKSAAQVMEDTAKTLSKGKIEKDVGTILGASKRGGYAEASFKSGVEGGAGMGAAYDNMAAMTNSSNPDYIAQTLKNRTSETDTKRHLIEDIGAFGLDKLNKLTGMNFDSEGAAAAALLGGGAVSAEVFQALRGQKGPIRTTYSSLKEKGANLRDSILGMTKNESAQEPNYANNDNTINQDDGTHKSSFNSDIDNLTKNKNNLQEEFKDIGQKKKELAEKYNNGKMGKDAYHKAFNDLDKRQFDITNSLDDIDHKMSLAEAEAKMEHGNPYKGAKPIKEPGFLSKLEKTGKFGAAAAVLGYGVYKGYEYVSGGGAGEDVANFVNWMTTSHGPAGGSGNVTGSSQYKKGNLPSVSSDTIMGGVEAGLTFASGFAGALLSPTDAGAADFDSFASMRQTVAKYGVPQHVQTAFATPSGFNTIQAMSGGSVYNNAMDSRNITPAGYKVDRSMDSYEATTDINNLKSYLLF